MLIDDDLVSREVTATILTMNGYTVHTAVDGENALQLLGARDFVPDAILMDAQMPGLSGAELIAALRAVAVAPIYAISGSNPAEDVAAAADGFLSKPFDAETLGKLLQGRVLPNAQQKTSRLDPRVPVIGPDTLAQFRGMMPEPAVREIYVAVVADLGKRAQAIEIAIARGDLDEVHRIGHAIKGGCGMAGALQAARLGALFEEITFDPDSNHLDNSMALLGDLRSAARNLERMLEADLKA
jgi:CheY-like chemotaxis protein